MQKIDATIARLRLLLADMRAKDQQLSAMRQQFRDQLRRTVDFSIYGDATLDSALGLMGEVQQRAAAVENALRDLGILRARAERELESLQLTKQIEAAKSELHNLLARQSELMQDGGRDLADGDLEVRIRDLRQQINLASEQAARTLGGR